MARKKQNPIDDLAKNVGGWLGGAARTFADLTDSSRDNAPREKGTQKFIEGSRMIGRTADALTGGFGSAALKDARKGSSVPSNLLKTAAVNLAAGGVAYGAAKAAGAAVRSGAVARAVSKMLPAEIGVHHSISMQGKPFTGSVRGSEVGRSLTAMDQQAGQSYYWSTKGKGGAAKAAREVKFQTEQIASKYVDFPEASTAMGYVTRVSRGAARGDPNLPGSIARQVDAGVQRVMKSVAGTGKPYLAVGKSFTDEDVRKLASAVRAAKAVEVAKSAAKIGGAGASVGGAAAIAAQKLAESKKRNRKNGKNRR
jgi:hypothetical protein